MEHTRLVTGPGTGPVAPMAQSPTSSPQGQGARGARRGRSAPRGSDRGAEVLYKRAADVDPGGADSGSQGSPQSNDVESSHLATPPQDLSVLVNQLYAQIKRELMIERERRGGLY